MSETDESEILAAKKRLNFYDEKRMNNPVSMYEQAKAHRQGHKLRKQLYPFTGDSYNSGCSSSINNSKVLGVMQGHSDQSK